MDALNLSLSELHELKDDLLGFIHRVANDEMDDYPEVKAAKVQAMTSITKLLIENTGVIRLQGEQLKTVIDALHQADYETTTDDGLIVTDIPEADTETTWKIDYSKLHKALIEAISVLEKPVYRCTCDCHECIS